VSGIQSTPSERRESDSSPPGGHGAPAACGPVAVVVLNWNGWADTERCLEGLRRQTGADFVVIVVDNGSTDGSLALLREWRDGSTASVDELHSVEHTREAAERGGTEATAGQAAGAPGMRGVVLIPLPVNLGFAAANNVAIRYALARSFPFVLLLNNDSVVPLDLVHRLVARLGREPRWAGIGPKVVSLEHPDRLLYAGGTLRLAQARAVHDGRGRRDGPRWSGPRETGHLSACCALYRSEFLREAGLLDEDFFFGHEDAALSCVARRLGWRLGVDLDVRILHREGASLAGRQALSAYYFNKYRLLLVHKHGSTAQRAIAWLSLLVTRTLKLAALAAGAHADLAAAEVLAVRHYLSGRLAEYDRANAAAAAAHPVSPTGS
jgi:hypothetical protein